MLAQVLMLWGAVANPVGVHAQETPITVRTLADKQISQLPGGALVWRLESFPTKAGAEAAALPTSLVAELGGWAYLATLVGGPPRGSVTPRDAARGDRPPRPPSGTTISAADRRAERAARQQVADPQPPRGGELLRYRGPARSAVGVRRDHPGSGATFHRCGERYGRSGLQRRTRRPPGPRAVRCGCREAAYISGYVPGRAAARRAGQCPGVDDGRRHCRNADLCCRAALACDEAPRVSRIVGIGTWGGAHAPTPHGPAGATW